MFTMPWPAVKDVRAEDVKVAINRPGAEALLGARQQGDNQAALVVHARSGHEAVFIIEHFTAEELAAELSPLAKRMRKGQNRSAARRHGSQRASGTPVTARMVSVADEIAKLVGLRDKGVLTDEEFAAQKARLLE